MKVLIIQLKQLGDVLLSTPLARAVKERLKAEVHFLTSPLGREIVKNNPFIDEILVLEKGILSEISLISQVRKERYDAVIDAQRTGRSKRITLLSGAPLRIAFKKGKENFYYNRLVKWVNRNYTVWERLELLKPLGIEEERKLLPDFFLTKEEIEEGREKLRELGLRPEKFFIVAPTARLPQKRWGSEKFGKLASMVSDYTGLTPLFVYAPGERSEAEESFKSCKGGVLLPTPLPIRKFGALLYHSKLLIGNDSFPSHLSLSLGKKTVVIHGPTEGWFPEVDSVIKVKKGLECQPCGSWKRCDRNLECYEALSPEEAFKQLEGKL
ncbi:glycosyltransferase family 9 protein [Thermovibrio sp.]